jgi:uncharacterized membrane protein YheB (UPF0754 family)
MDKGTLSNLASGAACAAGLLVPPGSSRELVLSVGLLALGGGVINAIAVKMLFDRIPGPIESGVVPARFREIRERIRSVILEHFFAEADLRRFIARHVKDLDWKRYVRGSGTGQGPLADLIEKRWESFVSPERLQPFIDEEVDKLLDSQIGGVLIMMGVDSVKPVVAKFAAALAAKMKERILEAAARADAEAGAVEIDEASLVHDLHLQVEALLAEKLEELDAPAVKKAVEDVIGKHLGWLVVWGNVLGALLGLAAFLLHHGGLA